MRPRTEVLHDRLGARGKALLAVTLTSVAGYVDALCSLALFHVFVANMSGNSIAIGVAVADGRTELLLHRGLVVPEFVIGLIASRVAIRLSLRRGLRFTGAAVFGVEAVLLACFAAAAGTSLRGGDHVVLEQWRLYVLVALPAVAMGMQNAALSHFGPLTVRTTHVTGTLAQCADHLVEWLLWARARTRRRGAQRLARVLRVSPRRGSLREAVGLAAVWTAYVVGAIGGAGLLGAWRAGAFVVPIFVLAAVCGLDAWTPIVAPEERAAAA